MINIGICDDDKRCRDILKQQIINTINEKKFTLPSSPMPTA